MQKIVGLIVLAVGAFVLIGYLASRGHDARVAPAPPLPSPPAVALPTPAPVPVPVAPAPAPPVVARPMVPAIVPTPSIPDLKSRKRAAEAAQAGAAAQCLSQLHRSVEYAQAFADRGAKQSAVDEAKAAGLLSRRADAINALAAADRRLKDMESAALAADPDVTKTAAASRSAAAELAAAETAKADAERRAKEATAAAAKAERDRQETAAREAAEREANDPVKKAIRGHYLVRGMTIEEAMESLGRPTGMIDAGTMKTFTWQSGGMIRSARFEDGVATVVSAF